MISTQNELVKDNNETANTKNKNSTFSTTIICCLLLFWMYRGFFPFNMKGINNLHYMVYDCFHLAFNIPNFELDDSKYYCSISNFEQNKKKKQL